MTFTIGPDQLENNDLRVTSQNGDLVLEHVPSGKTIRADQVSGLSDDGTTASLESLHTTGVSSTTVTPRGQSLSNVYSDLLDVATPSSGRHFARMTELDASTATDTEHRVATFASAYANGAPTWGENILVESDANHPENLWAVEIDVNANAGGLERGIDLLGTLNADPLFAMRITRGPNSSSGHWQDGIISEWVRDYHLRLRDGSADADKWRVTPNGTTEISNVEDKITDFDGRHYGDLSFYIKDEFGDNNQSNRTDASVGNYFSMDDGKIRARYRPSWTDVTNSEVTGNKLRLNGVSGSPAAAQFNTEFTTGEWKHTIQFQTSPDGNYETEVIREDGSNKIAVEFQSDGTLRLRKVNGGTNTDLISGTWPADTSEHTLRVTRDRNSNWELFMDGTSQGTATDTYLPSPNVFRCIAVSALTADVDLDRFELS